MLPSTTPLLTGAMTSSRSTGLEVWTLRACGVVAAASATYALAQLDMGANSGINARDAVGVVVGAAATMLGFLVSSGALLYAVANTRLVRNLERTGHFRGLLEDLFVDAALFLAATALGVACLFLPDAPWQDHSYSLFRTGLHVLGFAFSLACIFLLPVGWKMWLLLSNLAPDDTQRLE